MAKIPSRSNLRKDTRQKTTVKPSLADQNGSQGNIISPPKEPNIELNTDVVKFHVNSIIQKIKSFLSIQLHDLRSMGVPLTVSTNDEDLDEYELEAVEDAM